MVQVPGCLRSRQARPISGFPEPDSPMIMPMLWWFSANSRTPVPRWEKSLGEKTCSWTRVRSVQIPR